MRRVCRARSFSSREHEGDGDGDGDGDDERRERLRGSTRRVGGHSGIVIIIYICAGRVAVAALIILASVATGTGYYLYQHDEPIRPGPKVQRRSRR